MADAEIIVPESERPTHRLGTIPFTGEKVDTITWSRKEIAECTRLLDEGRARIREQDERGTAEPSIAEEEEELSGAAVDADGNPRLRSEDRHKDYLNPLNAGKHAAGIVENAAKGTVSTVVKGAEAVKGRVVGDGGEDYPTLNSAFVTFNRQISAHLAVQVLTHHEPYRMSAYYVIFVSF